MLRQRLLSLSASLLLFCSLAFAQNGGAAAAVPGSKDPWWKHAVFYEIYPRSFADSNNDGLGDLNGITAHLDYLQKLGVDAIWISPCYPSPQVDFGYDISDYENIAPEYGTLADFDRLTAEAKKRNIRIVMDLVMNHTSDKHPWFEASRSSKSDAKRDWYVWRDGKEGNQPPNNWQSLFGGSAWQLDPKTGQYYYHFFYREQPDLNWRNPEVKKAMYDVARFWLDRGVAGFRLDAITTLFEDTELHDNPILPGKSYVGDPNMEHKYNDQLPEVHDVLRELHGVLAAYPEDRVLIGETVGKDVAGLSTMYGRDHDEIQLPMNFFFTDVNKLDASEFRRRIGEWDQNPAQGWPVYLFSNHDQNRTVDRYGTPENQLQVAKLMAAMMLTLRGTPILYYGEEIGMENNDPKRVEDVKDPIGKLDWPNNKGRDGERTPMQWNSTKNAGFSQKEPWNPVSPDYPKRNVAAEERDRNSVLNFYRQLTKLRRENPALHDGDYKAINESDKNVLAYLRQSGGRTVVVALNLSDQKQSVTLDTQASTAAPLLTTKGAKSKTDVKHLELEPYGVFIGELAK